MFRRFDSQVEELSQYRNWGKATTLKSNAIILHSRHDDVIPFADSEAVVASSGLSPDALIEVGPDHRLVALVLSSVRRKWTRIADSCFESNNQSPQSSPFMLLYPDDVC